MECEVWVLIERATAALPMPRNWVGSIAQVLFALHSTLIVGCVLRVTGGRAMKVSSVDHLTEQRAPSKFGSMTPEGGVQLTIELSESLK